jgi:hypothetical protein
MMFFYFFLYTSDYAQCVNTYYWTNQKQFLGYHTFVQSSQLS